MHKHNMHYHVVAQMFLTAVITTQCNENHVQYATIWTESNINIHWGKS